MPVPLVQYIYIYRGLERVGSWVSGGSVGRDQLAMAAKVRRHWFNPCRLGSRGHLGADFSLLLYTDIIKKRNHLEIIITPRAHARARGYVIGRGVHIYIVWTFFWNQSFISKNTHFEMSILTQIGFSSNLMASGIVQQLDKSSWPSQIPIVCRLGKGSPMPETHIAPNHTPTIADTVPKWLNTPTLLLGTWHWLAS